LSAFVCGKKHLFLFNRPLRSTNTDKIRTVFLYRLTTCHPIYSMPFGQGNKYSWVLYACGVENIWPAIVGGANKNTLSSAFVRPCLRQKKCFFDE